MLSDLHFSVSADANYTKAFIAQKENISAALLNFISTEMCRDNRLNFSPFYPKSLVSINNSKISKPWY